MNLRTAQLDDAAAIAAIYAPYVRDTAITFEVDVPSEEEMRRRIARISRAHAWLVCTDGDAVLGYAYTSPHRERAAYRWAVDVAVYVHTEAQRRGIGRALYAALLPLATAQGYTAAYGGIALPNASSVGLHESLGFTPVGVYRAVGYKLGAWHDVGWWERALAPRDTPPAEPHTANAVEWAAALAKGKATLMKR
ncbi:MAG: arsinothricin resistance N-acetyltransferase ArsN1 family B [Deltaproteobacteria bacterium]|nr:arsinothricin resistance N-acetyltransferase ArsN1 family B [Deltaproteobacteria bacterium]